MALICSSCSQLAVTISAIATSDNSSTGVEQPIIHRMSSEDEVDCRVCSLLRLKVKSSQCSVELWPSWERLNDLDINLSFQHVSRKPQYLGLFGMNVRLPVPSKDPEIEYFRKVPVIQIYCLWDSPVMSKSRLSHRYRLHDTGSGDAMELIRTWLKHCSFSHTQCRVGDFSDETFDDDSELPTRVIDVGARDENCEPRLLVSNGIKGRWTALSHCWGNGPSRPLSTTKQNYKQHQRCIPMNALPKTFYDAVLVTRALDIRYIWIDSLCIIQNNENDKRSELPKMGYIYQHARLTILASEATNCSDGLFFDLSKLVSYPSVKHAREEGDWSSVETSDGQVTREGVSSVTDRVELPFVCHSEKQGSFFVTSSPEIDESPQQFPRFTPLFSRAWVTQEWTLSRRSILFLRDGIVWSCREHCENERGACLALQRPKMDDWQALIKQYSSGKLTYERDRLRAINGLATSLRGKRNDEYFAGLWDGDLPDNLLWRVRWDKKVSKELMYVPSWSWARHIGLIGFQLHGRPRFGSHGSCDLVDLAEILGVSHSGAFRLQAYHGWVHAIEEFDYHNKRQHKPFLKFCFRGYSSCRQVVPLRESAYAQLEHGGLDRKGLSVILDRAGPIGWADWDLGNVPDEPIAWVALKLERDCLEQYRCRDALHVLFLRPAAFSHAKNRFERVGMGVIARIEELSQLERSYLEII